MKSEQGDRARPLVGAAAYLADLLEPDLVEAVFVRSPLPHARIVRVSGALTAADLDCEAIVVKGPNLVETPWWPLATDKVRFAGEAVAVVHAEDRYRAEDLAEAVELDLDPCPAGEPLHAAAPDGVAFRNSFVSGDVDGIFAGAVRVFEETFRTARSTPLPLEARGVLASWAEGRLTLVTSTQIPHLVRDEVARCLRLAPGQVRVVVPEVGGGFGLKAHVFPEEVAIAALARKLGRPVRWVEDRLENLAASAHAHEEEVRIRLAVDAEGRFLAADATVSADVGAYSIFPFSASLEPMTTAQTLFGPYDLAGFRFEAIGRLSSKCPAGAYRGVGMAAAAYATERMVDLVAAEMGIDPLGLRLRNAFTELPQKTHAGRELDSGDYQALLARLAPAYARARHERDAARGERRLCGIGVGFFNEHSGTGAGEYRRRGIAAVPGFDSARVRVDASGRVFIYTSSAEAGQGHAETYRLVAAAELGLAPESVIVIEGDTDDCPPGSGTFVSRGAVGQLSALVQALREAAAKDLEPGLDVTATVDPRQVFPAGAHLATVEVDPLSLQPRLTGYWAVEDCGTVINTEAADGQVVGGIAMGAGGVLLEELRYSPEGGLITGTLLDYLVPLAPDLPAEIHVEHLESPSPRTELGSKGVGEAGTIGAFAAVANAVADAVAPLGARLTDLPYSPARLFAALETAPGAPPSRP